MRFALTTFVLASILLTGACSDSSYNPDDKDLEINIPIVQDPEAPEPLDVIISGSITDQLTGNIISNASVSFFEGSNSATNIRSIDGQNINSLNVSDGNFQVTAKNNITTITVVASADGYFDKVAIVNFDPNDEFVTTRLDMLDKEAEAVSVITEPVPVGGSVVTDEITVSTDVENTEETTEGSAQVVVPATVVLQDEQGQPVDVQSLSVEVSYIESQGYEEPETFETTITEPEEEPATQKVYISHSQLEDDQTISLTLSYLADNPETSGIDFSINYDSDTLTLSSVTNVFEGAVDTGSEADDINNTDNNLATNKLLNFSWEAEESVMIDPDQLPLTQHVYFSEISKSQDGTKVTLELSYKADDPALTGIGFTLDFDSAALSLDSVSNVFAGAIADGDLNIEGDGIAFGWASLFGQFPGSNAVELATITFDVLEGATGSTQLSIEKTSAAAGYEFEGQNFNLALTGFPGSVAADLATVTFDIAQGSFGYTDIGIAGASAESGYNFIGLSQEVAIGDEPEGDQDPVSIASLIPEGLNSDESISEVLVPIGVAEIKMTSEDGTPIRKFSNDITITINLPEDTEVASLDRNLQQGDEFKVRSFDSDTLVWTTEDDNAVVGELEDGLYPVNFQVDHLTIFAISDSVSACNSAINFTMTGDTIPEAGLLLTISSDDTEKKISVTSESVEISAEDAKTSGVAGDVNAFYQVKIEDYYGNVWDEKEIAGLCGSSNTLDLDNPIQTVNETLSVNLVCTQDNLRKVPLKNALVTYRKDSNSVVSVASQTSPGVYALSQLDQSANKYSVTIDTRTSAGIKTKNIDPDGKNESHNIEIECSEVTGTGTGSF